MKKYIIIYTVLANLSLAANAQIVEGVSIDSLKMERNGDYMAVSMDMDLSELEVSPNRAVLLTPRIVNGKDSLDLTSVGVYGRKRYYYYQRNGRTMISGDGEITYKESKKPDGMPYASIVPYEKWMNGSRLVMHREEYGCCNSILSEEDGTLLKRFTDAHGVLTLPDLVFVCPVDTGPKRRSLKGSAFIDFRVNKTVIDPGYRGNTKELLKITATIDSVRNDKDITVTALSIKGFASPESPYSNNTRLAKGRTEALKEYVLSLYPFEPSFIATFYEPEDWEGLKNYVEKSELPHKKEIIALINSNREPDNKEAVIKATYPAEYAFLKENCYPALRHSDYQIDYTIRSYTDVEEIKRIIKTKPQKLSLDELYRVAMTYEPGSDDFNEIFEIAVRMYPDNKTANLNAANTALSKRDAKKAKEYLDKAGTSPQADYARGIYEMLQGNMEAAREYFETAQKGGLADADKALLLLEQ